MTDEGSLCPRELYLEHVERFVSSFVQKQRRERWLHLLSNRPKQLLKNSHKLHQHLDESKCTQRECPRIVDDSRVGVFCDFHSDSPPLRTTLFRAIELGFNDDALFFLVPGRLAIYFFHEGFVMECRS